MDASRERVMAIITAAPSVVSEIAFSVMPYEFVTPWMAAAQVSVVPSGMGTMARRRVEYVFESGWIKCATTLRNGRCALRDAHSSHDSPTKLTFCSSAFRISSSATARPSMRSTTDQRDL